MKIAQHLLHKLLHSKNKTCKHEKGCGYECLLVLFKSLSFGYLAQIIHVLILRLKSRTKFNVHSLKILSKPKNIPIFMSILNFTLKFCYCLMKKMEVNEKIGQLFSGCKDCYKTSYCRIFSPTLHKGNTE